MNNYEVETFFLQSPPSLTVDFETLVVIFIHA